MLMMVEPPLAEPVNIDRFETGGDRRSRFQLGVGLGRQSPHGFLVGSAAHLTAPAVVLVPQIPDTAAAIARHAAHAKALVFGHGEAFRRFPPLQSATKALQTGVSGTIPEVSSARCN